MTDYLEQLLDEQEEEEPEQVLEWERPSLPPRRRQTQADDPDAQGEPEPWVGHGSWESVRQTGQDGIFSEREPDEQRMGDAAVLRSVRGDRRASGLRAVSVFDRGAGTASGVTYALGSDSTPGLRAGANSGQTAEPAFDPATGQEADAGAEGDLSRILALGAGPGYRKRAEARSLVEALARLNRAARQVNVQAGHRSGSAAEAAAENAAGHRMERPGLSGPVNYAALVDAAFARDARRYDGPLGLL